MYIYINLIIKTIKPSKSITFASDGPASFAKLMLQRKRRAANNTDVNVDDKTISSLWFTPGTKFMNNLDKNMEKYINDIANTHNIKCNTLLTGVDESETKILKHISKNINGDTHMIVSNDADVIVMCMATDFYKHLKICVRDKKESRIISIAKLVDELNKRTNNKATSINKDFALISLLLGNDYLPKVLCSKLDKIWIAYNQCLLSYNGLYINNDINMGCLRLLLTNIYCSMTPIWKHKFTLESYNEHDYNIYFDGLMWCMDMYINSRCSKYDYVYTPTTKPHPYGLFLYICSNNIKYIGKECKYPINKEIYAALILPKKAIGLIDKKYHNIIKTKLSHMYEREDCKVCLGYQHKLYELHMTYKCQRDFGTDTDTTSQDISDELKNMMMHHKTHKEITFDDIMKAVRLFEKV